MKVRFTSRADADIIDCYHYGFQNFGRDQAARYEQELHNAIEIIASNPRIAAERQEYAPPVRVHHHAKHYIIYMIADTHILIVRILRDKVDLTKHLRVDGTQEP
ncbi:MAG: type II toxin-antitoxin system RelE/ParE family toxin [Alphaproteobacteria bacterium]